MRPCRRPPLNGGTVQPVSSPIGKVSRWPLKISRRPGLLARRRATRLTIPGSGSTTRTSNPGIAASRACVALAMAAVLLGGLGEATRTSAWVMSISLARLRSTSRARASRAPAVRSLLGKAALPQANGHRQRPADEKVDHGNEGEDFERAERRGRELHAAPRDLAHRNDGTQRRVLDQLHEIRGQRWQGHADGLR